MKLILTKLKLFKTGSSHDPYKKATANSNLKMAVLLPVSALLSLNSD